VLDALFPYQSTDQRTVLAAARAVQAAGARRLWLTHSLGLDAHLLVAALAARLPRLELGIAVSLMPMRHPLQAAVETRTLAALTGGRFSLGLGVSEPATVERTLGLRWAPGPAYAREYLTVVRELVVRRRVDFRGAHLHVDAELPAMTAPPAPLLLGALGPRMAHVAGEVADGCICWLATPERVERVIVPAVRAGADQSGRAAPEVVALVPALVTDDPVDALRLAEHAFGPHIRRPHYRRALAADGLPTAPAGGVSPALRDALLAWGDPDAVATRVRRYMDAGATRVAVAAYAWGSEPRETFAATVRAAAGAMLEVAA
jgi:F420-dependent oxidoreductase-like protein